MAFEVLSEDGGLVLGRGWREGAGGERKDVLIVLPASEQPTPTTLDRLAHEYSFKDELDSTWAVRPLELVQDRGQTILVLEDPGGELLGGLLGTPMEVGTFPAHRGRRCRGPWQGAPARPHPQGHQARQYSGEHRERRGTAHRLRNRITPSARTAGARAARVHRRHAALYGAGTDRADESLDQFPERPLLPRRYVLPDADGLAAIHRVRPHGMGPLPHRQNAGAAARSGSESIPAPISQLVMKLLAKTAEERYQTAAGVEHDLRQCRAEWEMRGRIDEFPLAEHDVPDRLLIPEKLYGRSREVAALLSSFDRVVATGAPELVLVSGYSGIGKSSVVNELHKVLVPPRGLFASGKFDQYKRDIPYATVAQAFQSLVRQILSKSEAELQAWRDALREALGPNGLLIVDLIPELELVIGKQPPVAELSPQDAQRRFQTVLRRFIAVFARPEHPLALFLDDLQWLDAATLDLLEDLLDASGISGICC